jgi:hypothetical protein
MGFTPGIRFLEGATGVLNLVYAYLEPKPGSSGPLWSIRLRVTGVGVRLR